jgi:hypothetical protein
VISPRLVSNNPDLCIVDERPLPRNVAEKAINILAKSGLDIWVYVGNDWLIRIPTLRTGRSRLVTIKTMSRPAYGTFGTVRRPSWLSPP